MTTAVNGAGSLRASCNDWGDIGKVVIGVDNDNSIDDYDDRVTIEHGERRGRPLSFLLDVFGSLMAFNLVLSLAGSVGDASSGGRNLYRGEERKMEVTTSTTAST